MPRHEDFQKIYQNFIDEYGEEEGENNYHAWLNKMGYDDTKPMPKKEGFSWAGSIKEMPGVDNLIRGQALHPLRTVHPEEWPEVREYLEEELEKSAHTLAGKPLILDHFQVLHGKVLGAEYEDGAIEYVAQLNDLGVMELVRNGAIKHCSVEFEWKSLEQVNGVAPRGINFTGLSLLRLFQPGDPKTTVEVWEGIIKKLKEAKMKEQAEPQEFVLYMIRDPAAFLEERFSTAWIDLENGIQAIYGRLREDPENPQPMALLFMKTKGWTLEKMHGWLQDHSQYLRQPKPAATAPAGIPSAQEPTATEQQGEQEPEKDEHGCLIGKERWDPDQEKCVAIATEQQGDQEPEKDEHGCIMGKERYDEEQDKCVPIAAEQQGEQEPEKDEHGCIIGKERYDEEQDKCVPIEATEGKKKGLGEAIIDPGAASEPSGLVSRKEVLALIPDRRVWRSWSYGPQMLVRQLKRKLEG